MSKPDPLDYLFRLQDRIDQGENPIQQMMNDLRNASLHGSDETRRQFIDVAPDPTVLYRKMSQAEWNGATNGGQHDYDFRVPFTYTNTNNYRLWFSTSLDKVRVFDNVNNLGSTDVIVRFVFLDDLTNRFTVKAHQESGVQGNPAVVAMHREGFPSFRYGPQIIGNLGSDTHVGLVKQRNKAYNLGFTSQQQVKLNQLLDRSEVI